MMSVNEPSYIVSMEGQTWSLQSAVAVVRAGHPPALRSSTGAVAESVTWLGPAAAVMLPGVARWRWCGGVAALLRSWREEDNDHH